MSVWDNCESGMDTWLELIIFDKSVCTANVWCWVLGVWRETFVRGLKLALEKSSHDREW
jgi:hypothetical protein